MTANWLHLKEELQVWKAEDRRLELWWRDDDAVAVSPRLKALSDRAAQFQIPVHLAVIPSAAQQDLADYVKGDALVHTLAHGWAHENHADAEQKKSEFGTERAGAVEEAGRGLEWLQTLFGPDVQAVFVPPWNRIHPNISNALPSVGFKFLSTFTPRKTPHPSRELTQINTHIDPVDWRGGRSLAAPDLILSTLVQNLRDRRLGVSDAREPLGLDPQISPIDGARGLGPAPLGHSPFVKARRGR